MTAATIVRRMCSHMFLVTIVINKMK